MATFADSPARLTASHPICGGDGMITRLQWRDGPRDAWINGHALRVVPSIRRQER